MGGHEPTHVRIERVGREFRNLKARSCAMMSRDEATDTAVIFVHGFKGHPVKTWNKFNDAILAARDGEWNCSDIYFLGYNSVLSDIGAATGELTDALIRLLPSPDQSFRGYVTSRAEDDRTVIRESFADYQHLVLVGHSLGGVLVRNVVRQALKDKLNRIRGEDGMIDLNEKFPEHSLQLVAQSRVKLFAPAIGGARAAGLMGLGRLLGLDRLIFS